MPSKFELTDVLQIKETFNIDISGSPGGAVVENPPANAGFQVQALVREDPTCRGASKPVRHNY